MRVKNVLTNYESKNVEPNLLHFFFISKKLDGYKKLFSI